MKVKDIIKAILFLSLICLNLSMFGQNVRSNKAVPKVSEEKEALAPAADMEMDQTMSYQVQIQRVKQQFVINPNTKDYTVSEEYADDALLRENAFAQLYFNYLKSKPAEKDYVSLIAAYQMYPQSKELAFEMMKYYEKSNQQAQKKALVKNYGTSNSLKEYGYNLLQSVETNGVLVTYGEKDTYAVWYNQELKNIRKDVKVINYDLLRDDNYRKEIKQSLGVELNENYTSGLELLKDLGRKNSSRPIYYSASISKLFLKQLKNQLYPTGLAFKFSNGGFQSKALLKANWESFQLTTIQGKEEQELKMNYILPLYWMAKHTNKLDDKEKLEALALKIGELNDKKQQVEQLFKNL